MNLCIRCAQPVNEKEPHHGDGFREPLRHLGCKPETRREVIDAYWREVNLQADWAARK